MSDNALTPESRRALLEEVLRCIDREENLIHHRVTWGLQWNIALFAALFLLENSVPQVTHSYRPIVEILIVVFGGAASITSFIGVWAAHQQIEFLIKELNDRLQIKDDNWDNTQFIRPYGKRDTTHRTARRVSLFFPLAFGLVWVVVLLYAWPNIFMAMH